MESRFENRKERFARVSLAGALLCLFLLTPMAAAAVSDVEMTGFKITRDTESGRWEIQAGKAYYDGQGDVILEEVSARMVADDKERVTVVSDQGRYETEGSVLHLQGHVVVASRWGSRLKTPSLKWDGPRATMLAEQGVQLTRNGLEILGQSMQYAVNTGSALISGPVRTTWNERSAGR